MCATITAKLYDYLHSTMFLLIRVCGVPTAFCNVFTFHNVSINSKIAEAVNDEPVKFTFHNVSINSDKNAMLMASKALFTFHNVSINSLIARHECLYKLHHLHSTMFLLIPRKAAEYAGLILIYIPQCFY